MSTIQEDRENLAAAEARVQQTEVLYAWLQSNPAYRYDAAISILRSYHHGEPWTLESLTESVERLVAKGVIKPLSAKRVQADAAKEAQEAAAAEAAERVALVDWIISNRFQSDSAKEFERARMSNPKAVDI